MSASSPDLSVVSARWAGWSLLAITLSLLVVHGGAGAVAGQRVSGTSDVAAVAAFYSHQALLPLLWQHGLGVLPIEVVDR